MHGVVPLAVPVVSGEGDCGELLVGDLDPGRVVALVVLGFDLETFAGGGVGDQLDNDPVAREGPTPPVHGDEAEQAVLDPVSLRRPRWIVGHGDLQPALRGPTAAVDPPRPHPGTPWTARGRGDPKAGGVRIVG